MLRLKNICKSYGKGDVQVHALKNVGFTIKEGESVAIMGPSGSGKSTLVNILGGMDSMDSGEFWFREKKVNLCQTKEMENYRQKHISFVFQNFALMERYTAYENIELPLRTKGEKKAERKRKIQQTAEVLGIADILEKFPYEMSGGQKQRVAISRALVTNSDLILADEPTGALDKENAFRIMKMLKQINNEGKTVIVVTHNKDVADFCDRIVYLEDGRIVLEEKNDKG